MHLVVRLATKDDFPQMMRLCRHNGEDEAENRGQWDQLWQSGNTIGVTVHDLALDRPDQCCGIVVTTVVSDEFVTHAKTSSSPYVLKRIVDRPEALVSPSEIPQLNGGNGINLLLAYLGWEGDDYRVEPAPSLRAILLNAYHDRHGGNRLQWLIGEFGGSALLELVLSSGGVVLNDYAEWVTAHGMEDAPKRPYLAGFSHEIAMQNENQWIIRMFTYFPPVFQFTDHQRQILILAREGYTDGEIGEVIGVSGDAVKKRWSGIYERVQTAVPGLLPQSPTGGRGAEKRRALLAHLRERPEELRGYEPRPNYALD